MALDAESSYRLQEYIQFFNGVSSRGDIYQTKQEKKLIKALALHEEHSARVLLNSIIGHILFHCGKNLELVRCKMLEFAILLSQTAIRKPGVDVDYIFGNNYASLSEIDNLETMDAIVDWLNALMSRFSECIFKNDNYSDIIYKAISHMKRNYRREVTLEELARVVYASASYLSKIFKIETGYTVSNYMGKIRIDESKKLMADKSLDLLKISGMVGFKDQSYFAKVFKKFEGVSPMQYRKHFSASASSANLLRREIEAIEFAEFSEYAEVGAGIN
jgi:two-component system response regulator YesN